MKTWVRKSLSVGILAAAALLFAPGAANATARPAADTTAALGSSQSYSPITVPVTLGGTSLGNLGGSTITVDAGRLTESTKTAEHARVSPAVAGGHGQGNDNDFCDTSLRFLGGGQSFDGFRGFRGHRGHGHWHGGVFLGDSFNGFNDVDFDDDDLVGDDLFLGDIDDPDDGGQFLGDQGGQNLLPTKPIKGNGSNDGYGNTAPVAGNGNVAPTTVPGTNDGYGNAAPTTGNVSPATGGYGDVSPTTGDTPAMGDTPTTGGTPTAGDTPSMGDTPAAGDTPVIGDVPPTKPIKPTKPVKHHHKPAVKPVTTGSDVKPVKGNGDTTGPAVKPVKGNGDTTGYGDVSPATGSDTATDGGR
jgi:hypothetical protein